MAQTRIKHVFGNVLKVAIPLTEKIRTAQDGQEVEVEQDFYPNTDYPVYVVLNKGGSLKTTYEAAVSGNVATFEDNGTLSVGMYQVEVLCRDKEGSPCRYMVRSIIEVVDATIDADIEAGIEFNAETYTLDGAIYFYAKGDKGDQGVSIVKVEQTTTSAESGGINVIRVTLSNGETSDFEVRNGEKVSPVVNNETLIF